ncbi:hypothetical protein PGTUg99_034711 [Puccinia graminis f. sp. tritici]|uniref:Uncharacterized protein n=1 Tax=Puccinia graminis f. sp. tritici TaxID=56615 RepID=A0A5B0MHL3_PUCGR|nr:hypothetical protein PGTUg99_034711 [Puccinia graminis f. sp. tritici]
MSVNQMLEICLLALSILVIQRILGVGGAIEPVVSNLEHSGMEWEHTSTDLPQVSHSNLEDQIMGEAQKHKIHFRVSERKFWECASKTMEDMEEWKKRFAELDIRDHIRNPIQKHVDIVINSMKVIFEKKIYELRNHKYVFQSSNGAVPNDVSVHIFYPLETKWLKDIANFDEFKPLHNVSYFTNASLILNQWCDLIVNFLVDLKQHEILTDTNYTLTSFFNQEDLAHFVLRYLKIRLSHDIDEVYLNFNLKLSLQEDFSMAQMAHILKFLDQEAWKQIEFGYLKFWINRYLEAAKSPEYELIEIVERFLELSPKNNDWQVSTTKIQNLFENLYCMTFSDMS